MIKIKVKIMAFIIKYFLVRRHLLKMMILFVFYLIKCRVRERLRKENLSDAFNKLWLRFKRH